MKTNNRLYRGEIAQKIPNNNPIIFWDTCGILKIFHILDKPCEASKIQFDHFKLVYEKIKTGTLTSVTSELVLYEINQHVESLKIALVNNQNDIKGSIKVYNHLTLSRSKKERINKAINLLKIESNLINLFHEIMKSTYIIKEDKKFGSQAHYRLKNKMAPAHKKSEYKDCYIWLTFVTMVKTLPNTISLFYTENTKDFFENGKPVVSLEDDLNNTNGKLISSISDVIGHLMS